MPAPARPINPSMGTSLQFNIAVGQKAYETAANAAYAPGAGPLTVMAWSKPVPSPSANPMTIVAKGKLVTGANLAWSLSWGTARGAVRIDMSVDGTTNSTFSTAGNFSNERWHHVAFTYLAGNVTIYVDGLVAATSGAMPASLFASTMPVTIGGASSAVGTVQLNGRGCIQEVVVTTQVLTQAQIQNVMVTGAVNGVPAGATTSIWICGEDVGINAPNGTGTATDFGNANSPLTITGCNVDWYGRSRPRAGYRGLDVIPMNGACEFATLLSDPTNGWNAVARPSDILLIPNTFGALLTTPGASVGQLCFAYTWYDSANLSGTGLAMKQDIAANFNASWGGFLPKYLAYDVEIWANTPVAESNAPATYAQLACRLAHDNGWKFIAIPSIGLAAIGTNAHDIAAITDNAGKPGCDIFILQTQSYNGSVDTFAANVFPIAATIYAASPTTQIHIQVQTSKVGALKVADHVDLAKCCWDLHNFLLGLGKQSGLDGWGYFIPVGLTEDALLKSWGTMRGMMRPTGRTIATGRTTQVTRRYLFVGQVTAAASASLTDGTVAWATNQWAGRTVYITGGVGDTQSAVIVSNTATVLTITGTWTTNPNQTSSYGIA